MRILTYTLLGVAVPPSYLGRPRRPDSAPRERLERNGRCVWSSTQVLGPIGCVRLATCSLHVEDREGLGDVLTWELRRQLQEVLGFTVTLLNNAPGPDDFPLVLAAVRDEKGFWTPFYARRTVTALVKFSSNTSQFVLDHNASVNTEAARPQSVIPLVVVVNSTAETSSVGIISLPAHRKAVFGDAVRNFAATLKKAIESAEQKAATGGGEVRDAAP